MVVHAGDVGGGCGFEKIEGREGDGVLGEVSDIGGACIGVLGCGVFCGRERGVIKVEVSGSTGWGGEGQ